MQDGRKAVWSILYVSVAFFPSLKYNFIAYRSSKMPSHPDCIFEIHQLCRWNIENLIFYKLFTNLNDSWVWNSKFSFACHQILFQKL